MHPDPENQMSKANGSENDATRPTPEKPLLLGLLIDVSASMLEAMKSISKESVTRMQGFRQSFRELVERARSLQVEDSGEPVGPLIKVFAYGFGFGNPLSLLFGGAGRNVRDLLLLPDFPSSTVSVEHLAHHWAQYEQKFEGLAKSMFGDTPMGSGFVQARSRMGDEIRTRRYTGPPVLFVISDGEPTDVTAEIVRGHAAEIRKDGVFVITCFVSNEENTASRRLYGNAEPRWAPGAKLMFDCASPLLSGSPFASYLREYKWEVEPGARLFAQVSYSEVLSEFLQIVMSPLTNQRRGIVRVFVSYSHLDATYVNKRGELIDYLSGLTREGFDFWTDRQIMPGENWDHAIQNQIEHADIVLALVSQAFLNSPYCQNREIARLMERRAAGGPTLLPVILSDCDWQSHAWLRDTQVLPRDNLTVEADYSDPGKRLRLYLNILQELRKAGERVRK